MRDHVVGKVDRNERHVGEVVQVIAARRHHRFRLFDDQVVHDQQYVLPVTYC